MGVPGRVACSVLSAIATWAAGANNDPKRARRFGLSVNRAHCAEHTANFCFCSFSFSVFSSSSSVSTRTYPIYLRDFGVACRLQEPGCALYYPEVPMHHSQRRGGGRVSVALVRVPLPRHPGSHAKVVADFSKCICSPGFVDITRQGSALAEHALGHTRALTTNTSRALFCFVVESDSLCFGARLTEAA